MPSPGKTSLGTALTAGEELNDLMCLAKRGWHVEQVSHGDFPVRCMGPQSDALHTVQPRPAIVQNYKISMGIRYSRHYHPHLCHVMNRSKYRMFGHMILHAAKPQTIPTCLHGIGSVASAPIKLYTLARQ